MCLITHKHTTREGGDCRKNLRFHPEGGKSRRKVAERAWMNETEEVRKWKRKKRVHGRKLQLVISETAVVRREKAKKDNQ